MGDRSAEKCARFFLRRHGFQFSLGLSFLLAGVIAVYSLMAKSKPDLPYPPFDPTFNIIMFGLLALQSFQMMRAVQAEESRWQRDEDPER